jgi:RimJ/RimL family protein N-acetyltransferase
MVDNVNPGDIVVPGRKVYLGQVQRTLAPVYRRWLNDLHVAVTLGLIRDQVYPQTDQSEEAWFDAVSTDQDAASFTIYERETGKPVGNLGLIGIRRPDRSAELGIAIGDRSAHGKGYGTEATILALDYGFTLLGLHRIWLECVEFNHAALRVYERVGFTEVGRPREAWQFGGRRYDTVLMDILAHEFESPVLADLLGVK